ncbi:MAG: hypothetical protein C5B50_06430 [Verrucomicrobia bacterium]|nr:MAG: hypothetical protein C5B50_06430 [Verrucomicrobiota bacterium]
MAGARTVFIRGKHSPAYGFARSTICSRGCAARHVLTAQPTSNKVRTMQRTNCSCLVNRPTQSNIDAICVGDNGGNGPEGNGLAQRRKEAKAQKGSRKKDGKIEARSQDEEGKGI